MFRSIWTILRELTLSLAEVTLLYNDSVKIIVISSAVLWQNVFQVVVCVLSAVQRARCTALNTHTTT